MASFVESATLAIRDSSTKEINSVNSALKRLMATANKTASALRKLNFAPKGIDTGIRRLNTLQAALDKINKTKVKPKIDVATAARQLNSLKRKPIKIDVIANTGKAKNALNAITNKTVNVRVNYTGLRDFNHSATQRVDLRSSFEPLRGIGKEIAHDIQRAIITGFARATGKGYSDIDIAASRAAAQGISEADEAKRIAAVVDASRIDMQPFSFGQLSGLAAEALPSIDYDYAGLPAMLKQMTRLGQTLARTSPAGTDVSEGLNKYVKVAEQSGRLLDANNKYSDKAFTNFVDIIQKASALFGREIDPETVTQTFKALNGTKMSLSDEGIIALLGLMEEQRSSAGVQFNQMIKQISGDRVQKKQLAYMMGLGWMKTEDVEVSKTEGRGKNKKTSVTTEKVAVGVIDEELLRSNPLAWIEKHGPTAMRSVGLDPNKPTDVNTFANKITSDRTATSGFVTMMGRLADFLKQRDNANALDVSPEAEKKVNEQSGLLAYAEATGKVTSLLGLMANSLESAAIPALSGFSSIIQAINEFVAPGGQSDPTRAGIVAGGATAAGIAALWGGKKIVDFFTGIPANTTATNLNTAALNANTAAMGGKGGVPGKNGSKTGTLMGFLTKATSALVVADFIADAAASDKKTGNKDGVTQALTDRVADLVVEGRKFFGTEKAWRDHDATQSINNLPFTQLPPMNKAEMRDAGMFDLGDRQAGNDALRNTLTKGADSISTAGEQAATGIAGSIAPGAAALGQGIVTGAQTAAGILANAISSAANQIRIAATVQGANNTAPLNTGKNGLLGHN